jgi:hypothetical protein
MRLQDRIQQKRNKTLILPILLVGTLFLLGVLYTNSGNEQVVQPVQSDNPQSVLGATDSKLSGAISFNIPANFNTSVDFVKGLSVRGTTKLYGDLEMQNSNIDAGSGLITASNLIYGLKSGAGVTITAGQNPTISNTGVTSFQGLTGDIMLVSGDGIAIDGNVVRSIPQPVPNAFSAIRVKDRNTLTSQSSDFLNVEAGDGVILDTNSDNGNTLIISAVLPQAAASIWIEDNGAVKLARQNHYVGIGTDTPLSPLDVQGSIRLGNPGSNNILNTVALAGSAQNPLYWGDKEICMKSDNCMGAEAGINWGDIGGSIGSQADIQASFEEKENTITDGTTSQYFRGDKTWQTLNSTAVPEGSNLYYTVARFDAAFTSKSTSNLSEGTNLYYTQARFDTAFSVKSTTDLSEGVHLYYTDLRSRSAVSATGSLDYNPLTGIFSVGQSSATTDGILTATDWNLFNAKQNALVFGIGLANTSGTITVNSATGVAGGQTLYGGSAASESLTLQSTTNSVKGTIFLNPDGGDVVIGTNSLPTATLDVEGSIHSSGNTSVGGNLTVTGTAALGGPATVAGNLTVNGTSFTNSGTLYSGGPVNLTMMSNTIIGTAVEGAWSLSGNNFTNRSAITVTNSSTAQPLGSGEEVTISMTGADAAEICSNTRSDNNDLRIAYNATEISRNIVRNCPTQVDITFRLGSLVQPLTSSTNHFIYYLNAALAESGPGFVPPLPIVLEDGENASNWISNDNAKLTLSQESTITHEGSGSIKAVQAAQPISITGWTLTGQEQLASPVEDPSTVSVKINGVVNVYLLGGGSASVYKATLNNSGDLGAFSVTGQAQFPFAIKANAIQTVRIGRINYVYTMAGNQDFTDITSVYKSTIDDDGNLGAWTLTGQGQLPVAAGSYRGAATVIKTNGSTYLYYGGGSSRTTVYRSQIDSNGNIGSWTAQTSYPVALSQHKMETSIQNGQAYIYTIGGNLTTAVYKAPIDSSGTIGTWSTSGQAQLPLTSYSHQSTMVGNNIFVIGGMTTGSATNSTVYKATIDSSGNIGTFSTSGQTALPMTLAMFGLVTNTISDTTYFHAIGGYRGGTTRSTVYKGQLSPSAFTATTMITPVNLLGTAGIQFNIYSSLSGNNFISFQVSNDGGTIWESTSIEINAANTWETKTFDISYILNKNSINAIRMVVNDPSQNVTFYLDDVFTLISAYTDIPPTLSNGSKSLGLSNISLNAQGAGAVRLNYDATHALGGSGGFTVYNGGTTALFGVTNNGNISATGQISGLTGITSSGTIMFSGIAAGILKTDATGIVTKATGGVDYENPLSFGNGMSRLTNTITLGGNLTKLTSITQNNYGLTFSGGNITMGNTVAGNSLLHLTGRAATNGGSNVSSSGATVTAVSGSPFTNVNIGDIITTGGQTRTVTAKASNASITVDQAFSPNITNATFTYQQQILKVDTLAGLTKLSVNALGNVGVGTSTPTAALDVNGTFKLGTDGTKLTSMKAFANTVDLPLITANTTVNIDVASPAGAVLAGDIVQFTGADNLNHGIMVQGVMVAPATDTIRIRVSNVTSNDIDPSEALYYFTLVRP